MEIDTLEYSQVKAISVFIHLRINLLGLRSANNVAKEVVERHLEDKVRKNSKDASRSTREAAVLDYEELGGLLDSGPWDCAHCIDFLG
jgi:hypothetical protein